ncbi:hypothetical protein BDV12DRAFT_174459 [Aspergillus spectabilis]
MGPNPWALQLLKIRRPPVLESWATKNRLDLMIKRNPRILSCKLLLHQQTPTPKPTHLLSRILPLLGKGNLPRVPNQPIMVRAIQRLISTSLNHKPSLPRIRLTISMPSRLRAQISFTRRQKPVPSLDLRNHRQSMIPILPIKRSLPNRTPLVLSQARFNRTQASKPRQIQNMRVHEDRHRSNLTILLYSLDSPRIYSDLRTRHMFPALQLP